MKTKIVYVVASLDDDIYMEQAIVSAWSARHYNPDCHIEMACDQDTYATLNSGIRAQYKNIFDQIHVRQFQPEQSMKERSRWMKTTLREFIEGDFFFIDTDTVIIGDLSIIDSIQADVAMAYNANSPFPIGKTNSLGDRWINKHLKIVGWEALNGCFHFNSGVIFAKDTSLAKTLFNKWHNNWLESCKYNVYVDQPALTKANKEVGELIQRLDDTLNWQIQRHGCNIPTGTKILHYFASDQNYSAFVFAQDSFLRQIKESGMLVDQVDYYLDNIDLAFEKVTHVISEDDYTLLKEINHYPIFRLKRTHPSFFSFVNTTIKMISRIKAFVSKCKL
ncbi:MAG: hypothetical protein KBT06_12195 [Prevotellaceae bacterium]|nr:hypothetical protein [Candidatus Colivivens equi]